MRIVLGALALMFGLFIGAMILGSNMSPELSAAYDKKARVEAACDQMMSDAALGAERRATRQVCDETKARIQREIDSAPRTKRAASASRP